MALDRPLRKAPIPYAESSRARKRRESVERVPEPLAEPGDGRLHEEQLGVPGKRRRSSQKVEKEQLDSPAKTLRFYANAANQLDAPPERLKTSGKRKSHATSKRPTSSGTVSDQVDSASNSKVRGYSETATTRPSTPKRQRTVIAKETSNLQNDPKERWWLSYEPSPGIQLTQAQARAVNESFESDSETDEVRVKSPLISLTVTAHQAGTDDKPLDPGRASTSREDSPLTELSETEDERDGADKILGSSGIKRGRRSRKDMNSVLTMLDWHMDRVEETQSDEENEEEHLDAHDLLSSPSRQKSRVSMRAKTHESDTSEVDQGAEIPPFYPSIMEIAGVPRFTNVYCRHGSNKLYWPAIVMDFAPARTQAEMKIRGDRYLVRVVGFGGTKLFQKRRSDFFALGDAEFATFDKLGEFVLARNKSRSIEPADAKTRAATPPFDSNGDDHGDDHGDSAPLTPEDFRLLPFRKQISKISPELRGILDETYHPARARMDNFYLNTGVMQPFTKGDLEQSDVDEIIVPELMRWALREELVPGLGPRPKGSARYEALGLDRRSHSIWEVLAYECVLIMAAKCNGFLAKNPDPGSLCAELVRRVKDEMDPEDFSQEEERWRLEGTPDSLARLIAMHELDSLAIQVSRTDAAIYDSLREARTKERQRLGLPVDKEARDLDLNGETAAQEADEPAEEILYTNSGRPARLRSQKVASWPG